MRDGKLKIMAEIYDVLYVKKMNRHVGLDSRQYQKLCNRILDKYGYDVKLAGKRFLDKEIDLTNIDDIDYITLTSATCITPRPVFPNGESIDFKQRYDILLREYRAITADELIKQTLEKTDRFFKEIERDYFQKIKLIDNYIVLKYYFWVFPHHLKREFFVNIIINKIDNIIEYFEKFVNENKFRRRNSV